MALSVYVDVDLDTWGCNGIIKKFLHKNVVLKMVFL